MLSLRPRTWRDRIEVQANPDTTNRHVGLIAEELDDLGLVEFVEYDEEGRPDSVAYDRLSVALIEVVKEQEARLRAMEERLGMPAPARRKRKVRTPRKPVMARREAVPPREVRKDG